MFTRAEQKNKMTTFYDRVADGASPLNKWALYCEHVNGGC